MSYIPYPHGDAKAIAGFRKQGKKPAGAVEIILTGCRRESPNPKVYAEADQAYRWDWLAGLYVVLLIDPKTKIDRILADIERAGPIQIDVIDTERRLGWLVNSTKPRIETIPWLPALVADWLDCGDWHQELTQIKTNALKAANAIRKAKPIYEPEVIWN